MQEKWIPGANIFVVISRIWFSSQCSYHKLVCFHRKRESGGHNISFVITHMQEPQLIVSWIVSWLVFLCFYVNRHKGGFDKLLFQLLEQHAIICIFHWSHVQCLHYFKLYTHKKIENCFGVWWAMVDCMRDQQNDKLCESD